ncbi:MAG: hypothetical protein Q7O66_20575 [Dehalococcoidia bacterium]|nr:hypothetical protein [Dehalococcoidia bacterium]
MVFETTVMDVIQEQTGINPNDPISVGGAALAAEFLGSQEQKTAVALLTFYQQLRHEQSGEKYDAVGNYQLARQEYREALKWANIGTEFGQSQAADLHSKIAYGLSIEGFAAQVAANRVSDQALKDDLLGASRGKFREASGSAGRAGDIAPTPNGKALAYGQQADLLRQAGDISAACSTAKKAYGIQADSVTQGYVDSNCK